MDLRLPDHYLCDGLHRYPDAWLESAVARASVFAFTCQGSGPAGAGSPIATCPNGAVFFACVISIRERQPSRTEQLAIGTSTPNFQAETFKDRILASVVISGPVADDRSG